MVYPTLEKRREYQARWRQKRVDAYLAVNPQPTCECGCGLPVKFDRMGQPRRFVNTHQAALTSDFTAANKARIGETIPLADFAAAVKAMKKDRGWKWSEMADRAGMSTKHLTGLVYSKSQKSVRRSWARGFFERLAGIPTEPTVWQKRKFAGTDRRIRSLSQ